MLLVIFASDPDCCGSGSKLSFIVAYQDLAKILPIRLDPDMQRCSKFLLSIFKKKIYGSFLAKFVVVTCRSDSIF